MAVLAIEDAKLEEPLFVLLFFRLRLCLCFLVCFRIFSFFREDFSLFVNDECHHARPKRY